MARSPHFAVLLSFLLWAGARPSRAGNQPPSWETIPPEELSLKDCPGYEGCAAMILFWERITDDQTSTETVHYRTKIFTEEGVKYADVILPYNPKSTQILNVRARTVQPDGTQVDFDGEVYDRVVVKAKGLSYQAKAFTLPGVIAGSIVGYSYKVQWKEHFPDWLVHSYRYQFKGLLAYPAVTWRVSNELYVRRERFVFRRSGNLASLDGVPVNFPMGLNAHALPGGWLELNVNDVPPFPKEEFMLPEEQLQIWTELFYFLGYGDTQSGFWPEVADHMADEADKYMGKPKALAEEVAAIVGPNDPPEVKVRKIYEKVQQIRYLSYEHSRTAQEAKQEGLKENGNVRDILKRGYAEANEINFLFAALCRAAGFEARIVRVAGRNGRSFNIRIPDPNQLDALVVQVRVGGRDIYLDPATLFCPYGMLPWAETSSEGIALPDKYDTRPLSSAVSAGPPSQPPVFVATSSGKAPLVESGQAQLSAPILGPSKVVVKTPIPKSSEAIIERHARLQMNSSRGLEGTLHLVLKGQEALRERLKNYQKDNKGRREAFEDEVRGWLPLGAQVRLTSDPKWESSDVALEADFTLSIPNFAVSTRRRLLLPPAVFQAAKVYPFQTSRRTVDVYFEYPYQVIDDVSIQPPPGFRIEAMPAASVETMPFATYKTKCENQSGALNFQRQMTIEWFLIPLQEYSALRIFYDRMRSGDEQEAVLSLEPSAAPK